MSRYYPLGSYRVVSDKVQNLLRRKMNVSSPFSTAEDLTPYRDIVSRGKEILPERYHRYYLNVLESAIEQADIAIKAKNGRNAQRVLAQLESVFEVLAQPIVQLDQSGYCQELKAYLALASNMYRRFAEDEMVASKLKASGYLVDLDPMGFFVDSTRSPFTIAPSKEIPLAFVAKPVHYASYTPLYIVDAHEVGGHVLQSSITGFTQEVQVAVRKCLRKSIRASKSGIKAGDKVRLPKKPYLLSRSYKNVAVSTFISETFANWSQEFFCDVCGVLNLGPAYVNGLIVLLTKLDGNKVLSNKSVYSISNGVSTHPTRLLRVLLCLNVLKSLSFSDSERYIKDLEQRLAEACGGSIPSKLAWVNKAGEELFSFAVSDLEPLIEQVTTIMTSSKWKSLGNRSMSQLMTWGDKDEATARDLAEELLSCEVDENSTIEARHVVAASVYATEELSGQDDFEKRAEAMNACALKLMASLYEEQCLLCDRPVYGKTRRQDVFKLSSLATFVEKLKDK